MLSTLLGAALHGVPERKEYVGTSVLAVAAPALSRRALTEFAEVFGPLSHEWIHLQCWLELSGLSVVAPVLARRVERMWGAGAFQTRQQHAAG